MPSEAEVGARHSKAETLFRYGNEAALKANFEYAIQMYRDACKLAPESLIFRQALRGVQRRIFGNDPSKVGRLVSATIQPIRLSARASKSKGNWTQVMETCEDAFRQNPWDVGSARDGSEAAEQLGLKELARWYLESVLAQGQGDVEFLRHAAHVYELNEDWAKAIDCFERILKISPFDETAKRRANDLSAKATISRSRLEDSINKRAVGGSGPESHRDEADDLRKPMLSPEQRYLQEIEADPSRVGPYLGLAEQYKVEARLDEAEQVLSKGLKANPDDETLKSAHADVQVSRLERAIESWTRKLRKDPNDAEAKAKLEQLVGTLHAYKTKELKRRLALSPENLDLRFQLGLILAATGKHDEAIAEFQQARNSPGLKVDALYNSGLSFEANGVHKLAERAYNDAIRAAEPDDAATLNKLHYRLGRIAEAHGNIQGAEEHYNEVAANDYSYLDVAQRLRDLNKKPVED
ncbi:MAG: tetratricopeptide repeat protein [Isosphaeraceae bacterium]|nr:tetratricopeptide repeat protein [Isosphaeraceae bacterium]